MKSNGECKQLKSLIPFFYTEELEDDNEEEEEEEEEDDEDDDQIPSYGFPRNRREPSDIDFIISNAGMLLSSNHNPNKKNEKKYSFKSITFQMKIALYCVNIVKQLDHQQ